MMKRSNFWKEYNTDRDFFVVAEPDTVLLSRLIVLAKGTRTLEGFSYETGFSINPMYTLLRGKRKTPVLLKDLRSVAEHAAEGSGVTLGMLMAANGTTFQTSVSGILTEREIQLALAEKAVKDIPEGPYLKKAGVKAKVKPKVISKKEQFLRDMCYFCRDMAYEEVKEMDSYMNVFFEDKGFVHAAFLYHMLSVEEEEARQMETQQLLNGSLEESVPKKRESDTYKAYMEEFLKKAKEENNGQM